MKDILLAAKEILRECGLWILFTISMLLLLMAVYEYRDNDVLKLQASVVHLKSVVAADDFRCFGRGSE